MQGGLHAANTIKRRLEAGPRWPFTYRDLGSAAAIGRFKAIVNVRGLRLSGFPGWVVWLFVHIAFLNGFGHRCLPCGAGAGPWSGGPGPSGSSASGTPAATSACPTRSRTRSCPIRSPSPESDGTRINAETAGPARAPSR